MRRKSLFTHGKESVTRLKEAVVRRCSVKKVFQKGITKPCTSSTQLHPSPPCSFQLHPPPPNLFQPPPSSTHLHPAPSTSTQLISTSTQLYPPPSSSFQPPPISATPSTIFERKYCT